MNTIRCFYGQDLCKHLIELKAERSERLEAVSGYISNSDYKSKKYLFITFINGSKDVYPNSIENAKREC